MNSLIKTDWLQIHINNGKVSKCALEETLLSSSHRAQATGNQNPHDEVGQITLRLHAATMEGVGS